MAERPALSGDIDKFLSELGWREFCRHLLFEVPDLSTGHLQPSFDAFPWKHDDEALWAWQRGRTAPFDPDGAYVRRRVPELAQLPTSLIHRPWSAAPLELKGAAVDLGKTYPEPIIDHREGHERALKAYAKVGAS